MHVEDNQCIDIYIYMHVSIYLIIYVCGVVWRGLM